MNTLEIIIILFIVLVVIAIVIAMAARMYRGRYRGGYTGGPRNDRSKQPSQSTDDPRDVEKNILYSPITHSTINYNTKNTKYVEPNSDKQIATVIQDGNALDLGNLIEILSKRTDDVSGLLTLLSHPNDLTDSKVYEFLTNINPTGVDVSADMKRGEYLAKHYYMHTKRSLGSLPAKPRYLDLGGKEGGITLAFAKHINANDIHVVEVDKYDTPGIKYHIVEGDNAGKVSDDIAYKLPYDDNSFDVISAFMVLHHVKNLPSMISEVLRVLKPGGKLVIADHDCWDAFDAMLIDIEHLIYMVGKEGFDPKKSEWYMRYFNRGQLTQMLSPLKFIGGGYVSGAKPETAANRKFWSVYASS